MPAPTTTTRTARASARARGARSWSRRTRRLWQRGALPDSRGGGDARSSSPWSPCSGSPGRLVRSCRSASWTRRTRATCRGPSSATRPAAARRAALRPVLERRRAERAGRPARPPRPRLPLARLRRRDARGGGPRLRGAARRHGLADARRGPSAPRPTGTAYSNAPDAQAYRDFVRAAARALRRRRRPRRRGRRSTPCRASTTGRSGTSRTSTARCGRRRTRAGQPLSPAIFTTLLNGAYEEIHAVGDEHGFDPVVIAGGLYRARSTRGVGPIRFLEEIARARAALRRPRLPPVPDGAVAGAAATARRRHGLPVDLASATSTACWPTSTGIWPGKDFPIWLTEFGWQSKPGAGRRPVRRRRGAAGGVPGRRDRPLPPPSPASRRWSGS